MKDPRRFNFRRTWSDGDSDVVAAGHVDNWDSIEFRAFVWNNADGRGREFFEPQTGQFLILTPAQVASTYHRKFDRRRRARR